MISWATSSDFGLSSSGFIWTLGSCLAAAACTAVARAISPPSSVTNEFNDMFCALNGATRRPRFANSRHNPATMIVLPASEPVAWIMIGFMGSRRRWGYCKVPAHRVDARGSHRWAREQLLLWLG